MIGFEFAEIGEKTQLLRPHTLFQQNTGFLINLARHRAQRRLAALHAAAGQIPAIDIGMTHQQHAALRVQHNGPHTKRQRPENAHM